jgi:hypothetical protein
MKRVALCLTLWALHTGAQAQLSKSNPRDLLPSDPFITTITRYNCAGGQAVTVTERIAPRDATLAFDDRRGIVSSKTQGQGSSISAADQRSGAPLGASGSRDAEAQWLAKQENVRQAKRADQFRIGDRKGAARALTSEELGEQRAAYDNMMDDLGKVQPLVLKHKFKAYTLTAERVLGKVHFVNRSQGVDWSATSRVWTLKNAFSGRVLVQGCRQGVPFESAAEQSAAPTTE